MKGCRLVLIIHKANYNLVPLFSVGKGIPTVPVFRVKHLKSNIIDPNPFRIVWMTMYNDYNQFKTLQAMSPHTSPWAFC